MARNFWRDRSEDETHYDFLGDRNVDFCLSPLNNSRESLLSNHDHTEDIEYEGPSGVALGTSTPHRYATESHYLGDRGRRMSRTSSRIRGSYSLDSRHTRSPEHSRTSHHTSRNTQTREQSQPHRKQKEPEKFDGVTIDFRDFLVQFEQIASWNGWSESEMAQQLIMCLSGEARKLLSHIEPHRLHTYELLKESLTKRFCPAERKAAYATEFYSRVRKSGEGVDDYGYALRRLWYLAFPGQVAADVHLINAFVNGLHDKEMKKHISLSHPTTLESAIGLAIEYEAVESSIARTSPSEKTTSNVQAVRQGGKSIPASQASQSTSGIDELTQTMKTCFNDLARQLQSRRKPYCYYCGKEGHISPQCLEKQNARSSGGRDRRQPTSQGQAQGQAEGHSTQSKPLN